MTSDAIRIATTGWLVLVACTAALLWTAYLTVCRFLGDAPAWLAGLEREGIDLVFVQSPWPIEDGWMRQAPDRFTLASPGEGFRVYAVRRAGTPAPPPPGGPS